MKTLTPETLESVSLAVCGHFGITLDELHAKTREWRVCVPRQLTWYLLYTIASANKQDIAEAFNMDRTNIDHGLKTVRNLAMTDAKFAATLHALDSLCRSLLEGAK